MQYRPNLVDNRRVERVQIVKRARDSFHDLVALLVKFDIVVLPIDGCLKRASSRVGHHNKSVKRVSPVILTNVVKRVDCRQERKEREV